LGNNNSFHVKYRLAFDVGQGSANALLNCNGEPTLFVDIGCGSYRNGQTTPLDLILCSKFEADIILSHWDTDHWAGARKFDSASGKTTFLKRRWFAPHDMNAGTSHIFFIKEILAAGGKIHLLEDGPWKQTHECSTGQEISVMRPGPAGANRNHSALVVEVQESKTSDKRWLVTSDVDYLYLKNAGYLNDDYAAMSVPHHGASLAPNSPIPSPSTLNNTRLIYSFGPNNSYYHPRSSSIVEHEKAGWPHQGWLGNSLGVGPIRATACNAPGQAHLGSILVSWTPLTAVPSFSPCISGTNSCTNAFKQV
jgi:hypothetical protein